MIMTIYEKETRTMRCGDCLTLLNHKDGYYECPNCGWMLLEEEADDFDLYEYRRLRFMRKIPEKQPEGCLACGGDYPLCADACPLFD